MSFNLEWPNAPSTLVHTEPPPLEKPPAPRWQWILRILRGVFGLAVMLGLYGVYLLLTTFDQTLREYAGLCAGEERAIYAQVREVTPEECARATYAYYQNTPIPAKTGPGFTINVIEPPGMTTTPNSVYGFRSAGMLYIVLHKWKNSSAGICVPVENGAKPTEDDFIDYSKIPNSKWLIWKNDLQKDVRR